MALQVCRNGLIVAAQAAAPPLTAQVVPERTVPLEEQIKQEMQESRFRLGPIRLLPKFTVSEAGYDSNLFGTPEPTVTDWTARVSAGLHMLLPMGPKMYLRADALPEYDWYAHHVEQRTFGGEYSGSWLAFFNRMSAQVSAGSTKTVSRLNSENETFVTHHLLSGSGGLEVVVSRKWSLFGTVEGQRRRYSGEGPTLTPLSLRRLERDEAAVEGGVRYRWTPFFYVAAQVQGTQSTFAEPAESLKRDNRSTAYLLGVYYNRDRLFINLNGGYRVGRSYGGSDFPRYSTGTGSYFLSYFVSRPLELQAYGHRRTEASLFQRNAYYVETRTAAGLTIRLGYRVRLHGYGEYGDNTYPIATLTGGAATSAREDRFTTVGGGLSTLIFRNASITALVNQEKITSNVPGVSRSILRFTTNLTFEGKPSQ